MGVAILSILLRSSVQEGGCYAVPIHLTCVWLYLGYDLRYLVRGYKIMERGTRRNNPLLSLLSLLLLSVVDHNIVIYLHNMDMNPY